MEKTEKQTTWMDGEDGKRSLRFEGMVEEIYRLLIDSAFFLMSGLLSGVARSIVSKLAYVFSMEPVEKDDRSYLDDWTIGVDGKTNTSRQYQEFVGKVQTVLANSGHYFIRGEARYVARFLLELIGPELKVKAGAPPVEEIFSNLEIALPKEKLVEVGSLGISICPIHGDVTDRLSRFYEMPGNRPLQICLLCVEELLRERYKTLGVKGE